MLGRGAPFCPRPQGPKPSHLSHWQVFSPRLPRLTRGVALKSQISERPMFPPRDSSRRSFLAMTAGGTVAGLIPTAALAVAPAEDLIHAAIKRHSHLAKICDAAWKARGRCKDFGTLTEAEQAQVRKLNDEVDEAHLPLEAAAEDLCNTVPTTHAGLIAVLIYMRTQHRNEGEHMVQGWMEDEFGARYVDWCDAWLETIIQAVMQLDDVAVQARAARSAKRPRPR